MVDINNIPESFFREIRKIEIFNAQQYPYSQAIKNAPLSQNPIIVIQNIISEEFEQNIKRKRDKGSYYFDINIGLVINDLDSTNELNTLLNDKTFAMVLHNNIDERLILGNALFPLKIEVFDKIKNNNSGEDKIEIEIFGETILTPQILKP